MSFLMNIHLLTSPQETSHINTVRTVIAWGHLLLINKYLDHIKTCLNVWERLAHTLGKNGLGWPFFFFFFSFFFFSLQTCMLYFNSPRHWSLVVSQHPSAVSNSQTRANHDHIFKDKKSEFSLSLMSIGQRYPRYLLELPPPL